PPDIAGERNVDLRFGRRVETEVMHVSHDADDGAREGLAEIGAPLHRLVQGHLASDWVETGPERARERFIHYYGRARGEIGLGELACRTDWDAHRAEIVRGNGHEPHAGIALGVGSAPRDLDGRRQSTARERREVREGDAGHARERTRRFLDL